MFPSSRAGCMISWHSFDATGVQYDKRYDKRWCLPPSSARRQDLRLYPCCWIYDFFMTVQSYGAIFIVTSCAMPILLWTKMWWVFIYKYQCIVYHHSIFARSGTGIRYRCSRGSTYSFLLGGERMPPSCALPGYDIPGTWYLVRRKYMLVCCCCCCLDIKPFFLPNIISSTPVSVLMLHPRS